MRCMFRSDIEQAADQDSSRMQARMKYIPIEQLVHYAGKKVSSSPRTIRICCPVRCSMRGHQFTSHRVPHHGIARVHLFPALWKELGQISCHLYCIDAYLCDACTQQAAAQAVPLHRCTSRCMKALVHQPQVLVDVLGLVTNVGPMRSIKRKQDGTEFFCRDVTIADAGYAYVITFRCTTISLRLILLQQQ